MRRSRYTHNRARDLRGRLTSGAARRDEDYYDTDNFDAENDDTLDDMYAFNYDKQFQGGYHERTGEGNYGRVKIPHTGFNGDFDVYDEEDLHDQDVSDGLHIDREIEKHYQYEKVVPRRRDHSFAPAPPKKRRH